MPAFLAMLLAGWLVAGSQTEVDEFDLDFSAYSKDCGVNIHRTEHGLAANWPVRDGQNITLNLDLRPRQPLIESIGVGGGADGTSGVQFRGLEPVTFLTAGTRVAPGGRPPEMSKWNVFFDKPADRPQQSHVSQFDFKCGRVFSRGRRATVALRQLELGPFSGELQITIYPNTSLLQVEAVVRTDQDDLAIIYDTGLLFTEPPRRLAWLDTGNRLRHHPVLATDPDQSVAVRNRAIVAEGQAGSLACFPAPHQFFFPRDWSNNFKFNWAGSGHLGLADRFGFGIRGDPSGGGAFVPWFNAPPHSEQRMGAFYLVTTASPGETLDEVLRFTRGDRFPRLPGYITFTTHYHMAVAVTAMEQRDKGIQPKTPPEFVNVFKDMGVDVVHLAEFHGDGHPRDPGPLRLPELESMFAECRRLSDASFLLLPGEEGNDFLGIKEPGKHPGHWMSFFPKPVYWIMQRAADQPFAEVNPKYGTLYRVGNREDMVELLRRERGLAWTAHPRIKASSWTPDIFRSEDFYLADSWLGAAWKAMPADLSHERLGRRALDLLDDMANWGQHKYMPGEVDVFKIDQSHELYGHMNINYLRLDRIPDFAEGWQPILDALHGGKFFVSTGEILIRDFTVGGVPSGESVNIGESAAEVQVTVDWTFPLQFAEVISGDGTRVYRDRLDLSDTGAFGTRTFTLRPELRGRRWVRFEVWDVAVNGAFTQPVWISN